MPIRAASRKNTSLADTDDVPPGNLLPLPLRLPPLLLLLSITIRGDLRASTAHGE